MTIAMIGNTFSRSAERAAPVTAKLAVESLEHRCLLGASGLAAGVDLGVITHLEWTATVPSSHAQWYSLETTRAGFLSVEARSVGASNELEIALYAFEEELHPLVLSRTEGGVARIDWQVPGSGEGYHLKLTGDGTPADLVVSNLVTHSDEIVVVAGTVLDDEFDVSLGESILLTTNGLGYHFEAADVSEIQYQGGPGEDRARIYGSQADEVVTMNPASAVLTSSAIQVAIGGTETITVVGAGGNDVAHLYDSPRDDIFSATPDYAELHGSGFVCRVEEIDHVHGYSKAGGFDQAQLFDSDGDDTFVATSVLGRLFGQDFSLRAKYFDVVHAYATAGGLDSARLYASEGDNRFVGLPNVATIAGDAYSNRAFSFETMTAFGDGPGMDSAVLYDSAGNDRFDASLSGGTLWGDGFHNRAVRFDTIHAIADSGGQDQATFVASTEAVRLECDGVFVRLSDLRQSVSRTATAFDDVTALTEESRGVVVVRPSHFFDDVTTEPGPDGVLVSRFRMTMSPTLGIQEAIDALPPEGGEVTIPEGVYPLRASLVLRSGVTLRGTGDTAVLTRGPSVSTPLTTQADYGAFSVDVESTDGFQAGDEVMLLSDKISGWNAARCVISGVAPNRLFFSEPIGGNDPEAIWRPEERALVVDYFPLVTTPEFSETEAVEGISISNLVFDGNLGRNTAKSTDFRFSAIHLIDARDTVVEHCTVRNWISDGIRVQGGGNVRVENCLVENVRGHGIRVAVNSGPITISQNLIQLNRGSGIYVSQVDCGTEIRASRINENDRYGINVRGSQDLVIADNSCTDNSKSQRAGFSGIHLEDSVRAVVTGNRSGADTRLPAQKFGIEEHGIYTAANRIVENDCQGNLWAGIAVTDTESVLSDNVGTTAYATPRDTWDLYTHRPLSWFACEEGTQAADNVLSFQLENGGWWKGPKLHEITGPCSPHQWENMNPGMPGTFDDGATFSHMRVMAMAHQATGQLRFLNAFLRGLDFVLEAQYPSGGWPQYYPSFGSYHDHVTFNDEAMMGVMNLLRDVAELPEYSFVPTGERSRAEVAYRRGIDYILDAQIVVDGTLTAWCAQHDAITLEPRPARVHEKVSISGAESVGIVQFLLSLEDPSQKVRRSVDAACTWFEQQQITGMRQIWESDIWTYDRKRIVADDTAPPVWARFYEIGTNRPIFCGLDGVIQYEMADIHDRKIRYRWYVRHAAKALEQWAAWRDNDDSSAALYDNGSELVDISRVALDLHAVDYWRQSIDHATAPTAWVRFTPLHTGTLTVQWTGPSDEPEADLTLLSPDENRLLQPIVRGRGRLEWEVTAAGEYYLLVADADEGELVLANLVSRTEAGIVVFGTAGDDVFDFRAQSSHVVTINGMEYHFDAEEIATTSFDGGGGNDVASLFDSAGDDIFFAGPNEATLVGSGYAVTIEDVSVIHAYANAGGHDVAHLYDSPEDDKFTAHPIWAKLVGPDFFRRVKSFDVVHGYATAGGHDLAVLYGSAEDDMFVGRPTYSKLSGPGFFCRAKHFEEVRAEAVSGRHDLARLYGSPGDDLFMALPRESTLIGEGFSHRALDFDVVHARAGSGGVDVAELIDSAGDDVLIAGAAEVTLFGPGFTNQVQCFDYTHAYALNGGQNVAHFHDSPGDDIFVGTAQTAKLLGTGFFVRAKFFEAVHAYADSSGYDVARMYGSAASESFFASSDVAWMKAPGTLQRVHSFESVYARAGAGGYDQATLVGTEQLNYLAADARWVRLSEESAAHARWAVAFDHVVAELDITNTNLEIAPTASTALLVRQQPESVELNAADFYDPTDPTLGIQDAIDALPSEGGCVVIPEGTWVLRAGIVLRSRVTLRGAGSGTVLTRGSQAAARLTLPAATGETRVEVEFTEGLYPGDEVALLDSSTRGWNVVHATVLEVSQGQLTFTQPITSNGAPRTLQPEKNAVVVNYFPIIRAGAKDSASPVTSITISDMVLDGNREVNPGPWTDFTLSAIHLVNVSDSTVRNCTVLESLGDGISIQVGRDNCIQNNLVERSRKSGLHAGTGLKRSSFVDNTARHNQEDGFYFCHNVVDCMVSGNLFEDNVCSGIGGLGRGGVLGDRFNRIAENVCQRNGRWGIEADQAGHNLILGNVCLDNSQEFFGRYSGVLLADVVATSVTDNRSGTDDGPPTQKFGIEEIGASNGNLIVRNFLAGNLAGCHVPRMNGFT